MSIIVGFTKITNLRNWQIWARIHQRLGKDSNKVTKRGILTNGDYNKNMANLGENGKSRQNGQFKGLVKYK